MSFEIVAGSQVVAELGHDYAAECGPPSLSKSLSARILFNAGRARRGLVDAFVPKGYPHTVAPKYLRFQILHSLQGLCSYLRGVLSTRAVLSAMGVGSNTASAAAATTQWVYRDGAGMLSGLLFTWWASDRFGSNAKGWRLFADFVVDLTLTLELLSPAVCQGDQRCFTGVVCCVGVLRALCGAAAGPTWAVMSSFFAGDRGNLADVQAKGGSQETAVNLVGMVLSLCLAKYVASEEGSFLPWCIFIVLTVLHLVLNYLAVSVLAFPTLNGSRLSVLLAEYGRKRPVSELSVEGVNRREHFLLSFRNRYRFVVGVRPRLFSDVAKLQDQDVRCVTLDKVSEGNSFQVCMRSDATPEDVIKAIADAVFGPRNQFMSSIKDLGWRTDQLLLYDMGFRVRPRLKSS